MIISQLKGFKMKSRRFVQVMTIGLVICSMVVFAASAIGSGDPNTIRSQDNNERRVGGGGGRVSGQHVSGERPTQTSVKLVPGTKTARRAIGVNRHVMAAPERFPNDGVYLWCDPDGLWTMFWLGKEKVKVNVTVTTKKPITVKAVVKATISKVGGNQLKITDTPKARAGIVQFASSDDSVEFSILLNNKADPNRVYFGSRLSNPKQFPFKLNTRQTRSNKEIWGEKSTRNQESTGAFGPEGDSTSRSKKIPTPTAPSGGGGGRGGNRAGKAKK